jgi:DNA polymerase-4
VTRDLTLPLATDDAQAIRQAAGQCLKRVPLTRRLRLLGVRMGSLRPAGAPLPARVAAPTLEVREPQLFDDPV